MHMAFDTEIVKKNLKKKKLTHLLRLWTQYQLYFTHAGEIHLQRKIYFIITKS